MRRSGQAWLSDGAYGASAAAGSSRPHCEDHQRHDAKDDANPPPSLLGHGRAANEGENEKTHRQKAKEHRNVLRTYGHSLTFCSYPVETLVNALRRPEASLAAEIREHELRTAAHPVA